MAAHGHPASDAMNPLRARATGAGRDPVVLILRAFLAATLTPPLVAFLHNAAHSSLRQQSRIIGAHT